MTAFIARPASRDYSNSRTNIHDASLSSRTSRDYSHDPSLSKRTSRDYTSSRRVSRDYVHDNSPSNISLTPKKVSDISSTAARSSSDEKADNQIAIPLSNFDDEAGYYDLLPPENELFNTHSLEARSELLFSRQHLEVIFGDPPLLLRFTSFLSKYRQESLTVLMYYLDSLKALKAIGYSNAIAEALEPIQGYGFTSTPPIATVSSILEEKANKAFGVLVQEDLPAYITHIYVLAVSSTLLDRVTEKIGFHYQNLAGGLAETYCLSDPSRADNPIVFTSEGIAQT